VIRDVDGSFGGGPDSYVLINDGVNDSIATDAQACEIKPTWNAAVCKGDVGRLSFGGPPRAAGAGFGAAPAGGGGAGPGTAAGGPGAGASRGAAPAVGAVAGGPGAAPARGGSFGAGAPQPPVVLSRNGRDYTVTGTNVRAGTEIKVTTERPSVNLSLSELDKGSWVIFQLPGFTTAASGTQQSSLDALRKAGETSYFKDKDALWIKVVSNGNGANPPYGGGPAPGGPGLGGPGFGANSVQVSR